MAFGPSLRACERTRHTLKEMPNSPSLSRLLAQVAGEADCGTALDRVAHAALGLTGSRHAIIAVLNEELGHLEVRHGAGEGWVESARNERLPLDVGREDGIVGFVAATGSSVVTGNVRQEPHYKKLFPTTESEIAVPVRDRNDRVRAVLNLESDRRDAYGEVERETVNALSSLIGMVLEQEDHATREEALIQIGNSLDASLTEEALIDRVMHVAEDVLRLQACSIFLIDPKTDLVVLRGTLGWLRDQVGQISYQKGEGFTGWVCETGESILLDDPQGDPRWRGKYVEFPSEQIASFLAVPIIARTRILGAIRVLRRKADNKFLDNRFTQSDLRLLQAIAEQIGAGLENTRNMEKIIRSERMIAWGELSAKSSHMIGNRVFALKGDINELQHLLSEREVDLQEVRDLEKSLSTNVTRIEEILQDFRDFVTATQLNRTPTDLNLLVQETVDEVFPRRSQVALEVQLDSSIPQMSLDAKRLRRAVSELIENSLNYMDQGRLRVSTRLVLGEEDERTRAARNARFARLEIEDTGPGVDADQKALIFQPFFSNRVKGMGLGLSIVKGIVDAHGGEVFEAGEEGAGAKFVILLPVE